jgi:hypothetical protein
MTDEDYQFCDALVSRITRSQGKRSRAAPEAMLTLMRAMCVAESHDFTAEDLESSWRTVMALWNELEGPDAARDSAAWHWLGGTLAKPGTSHYGIFGFEIPEEPDLPRARAALKRAVECDPQNEAAWLALLEVLSLQQDGKSHNRLLGELVKRFPRNKKILALAGNEALARKTYAKSLAALEAALALDPLDKDIKVSILVARVLQTREYLRKGRPVAEQWALMEPLLEDRPGQGHLMLARWISRVRQGLLDPDPEAAQRARADAERLAPSQLERLFLENALAPIYKIKPQGSWLRDWNAASHGACLGWSELSKLLALLEFIQQVNAGKNQDRTQGSAHWLQVSHALLDQDLDKDPDGLLTFLEQSVSRAARRESPAPNALDRCLMDLEIKLDKKIKSRKKRKKVDPRLQLARLRLLELTGNYQFTSKEGFFDDLDEAAADAAKLGMAAVVGQLEAIRIRMGGADDAHDLDEAFVDPFGAASYDDEEVSEDAVPPSEQEAMPPPKPAKKKPRKKAAKKKPAKKAAAKKAARKSAGPSSDQLDLF